MQDDICVCMADSVRKVSRIRVGGTMVGIVQLERVIEEVRSMGIGDEEELGKALLVRASIFNYVPSSASAEYQEALLEEYRRRYG